jgi:HEAT repeat protein
MSIPSTCPGCGEVGVVPDHLKGKKVRCKKCQRVFTVGDAPTARKKGEEPLDVVLAEDDAGVQTTARSRSELRPAPRRRRSEDEEEPLPRRKEEAGGGSGVLITLGIVGVVGLLIIGGCGGLTYWGVTSLLCKGKEGVEQMAQQAAEVNRPPKDVDEAITFLSSPDFWRRQRGAEFLAKAPPDEAHRAEVSRALKATMADNNFAVRDAGIKAFAKWATRDDVPNLIAALNNPSPDVRCAVLEKLGQLKDERAAGPVAQRLSDWSDRSHAANALQNMGAAAEKEVIRYLTHSDDQVRAEALRVLRAIGTKDAVITAQLVTELQAPLPPQRRGAAEWLAQAVPDPAQQPKVVKALEPALRDVDVQTQRAAARALAAWATRDNLPLLIATLGHNDPEVRKAMMTGLVQLKDERGIAAIAQRLTNVQDRISAADALIKVGPAAEKEVLNYLEDPDFSTKSQARRVLQAIGRKGVDLDEKLAELKSPDRFARRRAVDWLVNAPVDNARRAEVAKALEAVLRDGDLNVSGAALAALGSWGTKDNVAAIVGVLNDLSKNLAATPVRHAALVALAKIKDEQCVAPVAARLAALADLNVAGEALVAMGPMVEGEVAKYLKPPHASQTRVAACVVLRQVGTKASLPMLEEIAADKDRNVSAAARIAINEINAREKK